MPTKVLVLGGSGMLGAMVVDFLARQPGLQVSAAVRTEELRTRCQQALPTVNWRLFDAAALDPAGVEQTLAGQECVINAVGVIKPYIHDDNAAEVERAVRINALFPHLLTQAAETTGIHVLQIATDCVYSGQKGCYVETDKHDALDAYGKTKSLGEVTSKCVTHLRCSIIGPEPKAHVSLLDWFRGQPRGAKVNGYTNHRWNGVTTLHFAKLCHGVIVQKLALPQALHIVPTGDITKSDLLKCFATNYNREDVTIQPGTASVIIDRTLATRHGAMNASVWAAAGYASPPSVPQMVKEMAAYETKVLNLSPEKPQ